MKFQRSIAVAVGLSLALFVAGCGDDSDSKSDGASMKKDDSVMVGGAAMLASKNVVENASKASNLTTLVAAVTAADLVETLSGDGPFTVFAPDNDAFAKVDKATLDNLLKPENKEQLASILTYHVVPGTLAAEDLKDGDKLTTVNGGDLTVGVDGDTVTLTDANGGVSTVTQADVFQKNGVAHVIDTVLMPKSDDAMSMKKSVEVGGAAMLPSLNVVQNASKAKNLTTAVAAIKAAGLVQTLSGEGPFTVFAPDNAAFAKVDKAALANLLKPANKAALANILTYHVVPGTLAAADLKDGDKLTTVNGGELTVGVDGDTVTLTDANGGVSTVTQADVFQSNGVAHIIDTVLMPKA